MRCTVRRVFRPAVRRKILHDLRYLNTIGRYLTTQWAEVRPTAEPENDPAAYRTLIQYLNESIRQSAALRDYAQQHLEDLLAPEE